MAGDPSHFERLGLPRRFDIDPAELERCYLERSRAVHPDHTGNDPASLEVAAAINEAYSILRDPFRRAEYLLTLEGGPSATAVRQPPPAFLEEMLELRMRIEEAKSNPAANAEFDSILRERRERLLGDAARSFGSLTSTADRAGALATIRQTLNATKFVTGLLRDLHEDPGA